MVNKINLSNRVLALLQLTLLVSFIVWQLFYALPERQLKEIPQAFETRYARLASMGEPALMAKFIIFWLQTYDSQSGQIVHFRQLNYAHLIEWFEVVESLDSQTVYPLLVASRIFTEVDDQSRIRMMIKFVHHQFFKSPETRWRWLMHCAIIAKHRLHDNTLALKLVQDLNTHTQNKDVPFWVRDMEFLLLEEIGEYKAAVLLIKRMLESGLIKDANELMFLTHKLKTIKEKQHQ